MTTAASNSNTNKTILTVGVVGIGALVAYELLKRKPRRSSGGGGAYGPVGGGGQSSPYYPYPRQSQGIDLASLLKALGDKFSGSRSASLPNAGPGGLLPGSRGGTSPFDGSPYFNQDATSYGTGADLGGSVSTLDSSTLDAYQIPYVDNANSSFDSTWNNYTGDPQGSGTFGGIVSDPYASGYSDPSAGGAGSDMGGSVSTLDSSTLDGYQIPYVDSGSSGYTGTGGTDSGNTDPNNGGTSYDGGGWAF